MFAGVARERLFALVQASSVRTFVADDIICQPKTVMETVDFILDGFADDSRANMSGWLSSMRILKKGELVATEVFSEGEGTKGCVTATSDNMQVLSMPKEAILAWIETNPIVAFNLFKIMQSQINAMTTLWLLSESL